MRRMRLAIIEQEPGDELEVRPARNVPSVGRRHPGVRPSPPNGMDPVTPTLNGSHCQSVHSLPQFY